MVKQKLIRETLADVLFLQMLFIIYKFRFAYRKLDFDEQFP